jgi:hypothetical protein
MTKTLILVLAFLNLKMLAQDMNELAKPVVAEGKLLYRSEMASWYGTDLFLEKFKQRELIGGYFSYTDNDEAKCIFFSKGDKPKVIGTISFDNTYNTQTAKVDMAERDFSPVEADLYAIRKIALNEIKSDTLFKVYQNTNLNLIPLINGRQKKVYVLTGPEQGGVVIFGNDYLLTFDETNKLLQKKQLHKNIIPIYYGKEEEEGKEVEDAIHNHSPETGDLMTATDVCTLMLYEKFAKWKTHNVVSEKYLNLWNCKTDELTVISMEVVDKINKDQEKRHKKK